LHHCRDRTLEIRLRRKTLYFRDGAREFDMSVVEKYDIVRELLELAHDVRRKYEGLPVRSIFRDSRF
jgi:hypothetical protein